MRLYKSIILATTLAIFSVGAYATDYKYPCSKANGLASSTYKLKNTIHQFSKNIEESDTENENGVANKVKMTKLNLCYVSGDLITENIEYDQTKKLSGKSGAWSAFNLRENCKDNDSYFGTITLKREGSNYVTINSQENITMHIQVVHEDCYTPAINGLEKYYISNIK